MITFYFDASDFFSKKKCHRFTVVKHAGCSRGPRIGVSRPMYRLEIKQETHLLLSLSSGLMLLFFSEIGLSIGEFFTPREDTLIGTSVCFSWAAAGAVANVVIFLTSGAAGGDDDDKIGNGRSTTLSRMRKVLVFRTMAGMILVFAMTAHFPGANMATADAASWMSKGILSTFESVHFCALSSYLLL